jgi:hypothetical protein
MKIPFERTLESHNAKKCTPALDGIGVLKTNDACRNYYIPSGKFRIEDTKCQYLFFVLLLVQKVQMQTHGSF